MTKPLRLPAPASASHERQTEQAPSEEPPDNPYGWPFVYSYLGNLALMVPISLLFRYADFVKVLGGSESDLGWIVGAGMVGSLLMRFAQGVGIDRFGAGRVWFWSALVFALTCLAHVRLSTVHSPVIYLVRIAFQTSIAGAFGASITYISNRVSVHRVPEIVGTLGTSGFIGMMGGTLLGDLLCAGHRIQRWHVDRMFYIAAALGLAGAVFAWLATRGEVRGPLRRRSPLWYLLRRYHPGWLLMVAVTVGIGIGLPNVYLRPYTESLHIPGIMFFFWVYAPTAFVTRIAVRRLPEKIGARPMIFLGLGCLAASLLLYPLCVTWWLLVLPGVLVGVAHAFLFPSVTGWGSTAFPSRYRGTGVTLMLSMVDLGNLVGAPLAGMLLALAPVATLPPFPTMWVVMALLVALAGVAYAVATRSVAGSGLAEGSFPRPNGRRRNGTSAGPPVSKRA
jgi:MFS family permease